MASFQQVASYSAQARCNDLRVRLSRRQPPAHSPAARIRRGLPAPVVAAAGRLARPAVPTAALVVEDDPEARIRLPTDLLRFMTSCLEIALLVGVGLLGKATAAGLEVDVVGVTKVA